MTLKMGTGGGEKKRARVGEGYGGFRGFEKGRKEKIRGEKREIHSNVMMIFSEKWVIPSSPVT